MTKGISRRDFMKGAAGGVAGAAVAGLFGGCQPSSGGAATETPATAAVTAEAATKAPETEKAAEPETTKAAGVSGTGTGKARGNGGEVTVTLTVEDGKIVDVEAVGDQETEGIGSRAIEQLPARMIEADTVEVDTVTGATITSTAVLTAAAAAYAEATGEKKEAKVEDGRYVSSVMGMMDYVYVATSFEGGKIKEVRFLSSNETEHLSWPAIEEIPPKIVEHQSINVDTIAGCTVTSNAIIQCVREAIMKAGGDPADFMERVPAPEVTASAEEREVDVAIVGAGVAGLNAAYNLALAGKSVLVFDKMGYYGGCFLVSGGLIMSVDTILHKNYGPERLAGYMKSKEAFIESYEAVLDKESPYYNPDMPYIKVMIEKGSQMVDNLILAGVGFAPLNKYGSNPYIGSGPWGNYKQTAGSVCAVEMMYDQITKRGNEVILKTKVESLIMDGDAVVGLKAKGEDGREWTVHAKAVLLATGGWMQNRELVEEYCPDYADYYVNAPVSNTGDGLFLAKEAGGAWICMDQGITATNKAYTSKSNTIFFYKDVPLILVDANGERLVNEVSSYKKYLRKFKEPQYGGRFYYVFDEVGFALAHDSDTYDLSYQYLINKGDIVEYESLDALSEQLDLPHLKETVEQVNRIANGEEEDEFGNKTLPYLETKGKMYAMRIEPGAYITHGGIKIDPQTRVLREDDTVIKGLYSAGMTTGSMEIRDGGDYGNGNCQALAFSLQAAETIASDIG